MPSLTVVPAYGRDYATESGALKAWNEGLDWQNASFTTGTYVSKGDVDNIKQAGFNAIRLRFNKQTKIVEVKL